MTVEWETYLDKVYGMLAGSVLGNISGKKENGVLSGKNEGAYTSLGVMIPLLRTLDNKGPNYSPEALSDNYEKYVGFISEEYEFYRRNYRLGLKPPYSGTYDNPFGNNITGSFRGGYYGILAPGNPAMAVALCEKVPCIECGRESFEAEKFFSALAAYCITGKHTAKERILKAAEYIDRNSIAYEIITKTVEWCEEKADIKYIKGKVEREYSSADSKNFKQNLSVAVAALVISNGKSERLTEIVRSAEDVCNYEYCMGLAGQMCGISEGGKKLEENFNVRNVSYYSESSPVGLSETLFDIATDIAHTGLLYEAANGKYTIAHAPAPNAPAEGLGKNIYCTFEYENGKTVIRPGESVKIRIRFHRTGKINVAGTVRITPPEGFTVRPQEADFALDWIRNQNPEFTVTMSKNETVIMKKNIFQAYVKFKDGDAYTETFGIAGADVYSAYGPFRKEYVKTATEEEYSAGWNDKEKAFTEHYQKSFNKTADIGEEYMEDQLLSGRKISEKMSEKPGYACKKFYKDTEKISPEDVFGCEGPCVIYLVKDVFSERDMNIKLEIGYSEPFRLWQDGKTVAYSDGTGNYAPKNIIRNDLVLHKNVNRFTVKLARTCGKAEFSMTIYDDLTGKRESDIITDIGTMI